MRSFWCALFSLIFIPIVTSAEVNSPHKIYFIGDSITEGYGVEKSAAYPAQLSEMLHKNGRTNTELVNSGISGSTSASGLQRLQWILKSNPSAIVIALGSNDVLRGINVQSTKKNLESMITAAQAKHVKVLLTGVRAPPNYGKDYDRQLQKAFKELVNKYHIVYMPFLLEGVGGDKNLNQYDGIHPNEKGHKLIAEKMLRYLEQIL